MNKYYFKNWDTLLRDVKERIFVKQREREKDRNIDFQMFQAQRTDLTQYTCNIATDKIIGGE